MEKNNYLTPEDLKAIAELFSGVFTQLWDLIEERGMEGPVRLHSAYGKGPKRLRIHDGGRPAGQVAAP